MEFSFPSGIPGRRYELYIIYGDESGDFFPVQSFVLDLSQQDYLDAGEELIEHTGKFNLVRIKDEHSEMLQKWAKENLDFAGLIISVYQKVKKSSKESVFLQIVFGNVALDLYENTNIESSKPTEHLCFTYQLTGNSNV